MSPEWDRYWRTVVGDLRRKAKRLRDSGYTELAEGYAEEAQTIEDSFLAEAEIVGVEEPAVAVKEDPGTEWEGISELEERYLHGDK